MFKNYSPTEKKKAFELFEEYGSYEEARKAFRDYYGIPPCPNEVYEKWYIEFLEQGQRVLSEPPRFIERKKSTTSSSLEKSRLKASNVHDSGTPLCIIINNYK